MSTTKTSREIPLDEVRRTLSGALGPAYQVTATSDSTLKIWRLPLVTATVKISWQDGGTTLQAAPAKPGSSRASTRSPSTPSYATPSPRPSRQRLTASRRPDAMPLVGVAGRTRRREPTWEPSGRTALRTTANHNPQPGRMTGLADLPVNHGAQRLLGRPGQGT